VGRPGREIDIDVVVSNHPLIHASLDSSENAFDARNSVADVSNEIREVVRQEGVPKKCSVLGHQSLKLPLYVESDILLPKELLIRVLGSDEDCSYAILKGTTWSPSYRVVDLVRQCGFGLRFRRRNGRDGSAQSCQL
jgi:hypothetical protein